MYKHILSKVQSVRPTSQFVFAVEDHQPECGLLWRRGGGGGAGAHGPGLQSVSPPASLPARQDRPHRQAPPGQVQPVQEGGGGGLPRGLGGQQGLRLCSDLQADVAGPHAGQCPRCSLSGQFTLPYLHFLSQCWIFLEF